jgi:molecular chaperone GrpE
MPHRTRAQERADEIDISPTKLLAQIDELKRQLEDSDAQANEYLAGLQRERAEFQNFRRRTADERERDAGLAADGLLRKVVALADDFDRAIETRPASHATDPWADGIAAIDRKLRLLLESEGVNTIAVAPGAPFDPALHDAIVTVPDSGQPEGTIVTELQRGYRIRDRVLRPALVAVASGPEPPGGPADFEASDEPADGPTVSFDPEPDAGGAGPIH